MPLWYGITLIGLSAAILANLLLRREPGAKEEPIGKPLVVLAALAAAIVGLDLVGFAPSIFLLLLVLFAAVERLPSAALARRRRRGHRGAVPHLPHLAAVSPCRRARWASEWSCSATSRRASSRRRRR